MPKRICVAAIVCVAFLVGSCAHLKRNRDTYVGAVAGCGVGFGVCKLAGGSDRQCLAACAAGAATGAVVGAYFDHRRKQLELVAERTHTHVVMTDVAVEPPSRSTAAAKSGASCPKNGLVAEIGSQGMFRLGSATPTPRARRALFQLGQAYARPENSHGQPIKTKLLITGHTDSTGTARRNQALSEARAKAVAAIFVRAGVPATALFVKGAGSSQPISDNATAAGRARNRRVEILEIDNESDLLSYAAARAQDRRNLVHSTGPQVRPHTVTRSAPREVPITTVARSRKTVSPNPSRQGVPPAVAERESIAQRYSFGGRAVGATARDLSDALGPPPQHLLWRFHRDVHEEASDKILPCYADAPRQDGAVRRYSDNAVVSEHGTADYLPGMYGPAWGGVVGATKVGFSPVKVLRDDAQAVGTPQVLLQRNTKGAPSSRFRGVVNTYEGQKGVLYRVFLPESSAPFVCFDVVLPKSAPFHSPAGWLYYPGRNGWKQASFTPVILTGHS